MLSIRGCVIHDTVHYLLDNIYVAKGPQEREAPANKYL